MQKSLGPEITSLRGAKEDNEIVWIPMKPSTIDRDLIPPNT
jgi:hypothetical protein